MYIEIIVTSSITAVLMLIIFSITQLRRRKKTKRKEDQSLKGIVASITQQLNVAFPSEKSKQPDDGAPGIKWRWVCYPAGFASSGGIARIDVVNPDGKQWFIDVCRAINGYMALHMSNAVEIATPVKDSISANVMAPINITKVPERADTSNKGAGPTDEKGVSNWFNIVLMDPLSNLINELHAKSKLCLYISQDGKAYTDEDCKTAAVHDFGQLPDITLWDHIIEKLGGQGLLADVQKDNCIFVSWA